MRLAIAGRSNEQNAALPGHAALLVGLAGGKKLCDIGANILLQTSLQNQIIKGRIFNIMKKVLILIPVAIIKNKNLAAQLCIPLADGYQKTTRNLFVLGHN